jgi:hypothetical protein
MVTISSTKGFPGKKNTTDIGTVNIEGEKNPNDLAFQRISL